MKKGQKKKKRKKFFLQNDYYDGVNEIIIKLNLIKIIVIITCMQKCMGVIRFKFHRNDYDGLTVFLLLKKKKML